MKKYRLYLNTILIAGCFACLLLTGCGFQKIGSDLGKGVSGTTDSMGRGLVDGIRDELANPVTREKVSRLLDSILQSVTDTLGVKIKLIEDGIPNRKISGWVDSLVEAVTGNKLNGNMQRLQATLVGKTKDDVKQMQKDLQQLLADLLSDNTRSKLGLIRNELLGPKTSEALVRIIDTAVSHIVDSTMTKISEHLRTEINPQLRGDISFVQKNASYLLITLGAIAAVIILLVWRNRAKYLRMVAIIGKHIHDIPDQQIYDSVTAKIKKDSVAAGVEPDLRNLLDKNGLIGTGSWKKETDK